ncbi:MAG: hypothetical protein Q9166_001784 [cf. Caloplaca sp. 2 TL-2023]
MPVTIKTAAHGARATYMSKPYFASSSQDLYNRSRPRGSKHESLLQSSFPDHLCESQNLFASANGFVFGAIDAYNQHHHLTIRPDDIWFAILSQFGCWIHKHGEDENVRKLFVTHEGKKELEIVYGVASRFIVDFGDFAMRMTRLMEQNVVDPDLRKWMMPGFTTSTETDNVVASVLMMGALQPFFAYSCDTMCGIPSVTLMGEEIDWERILGKLAKLATFGVEPAKFAELLKPVIERFVQCFESPGSEDVRRFWQLIVSKVHEGSGESYYSGWITAFCFWDKEGNNLHYRAYPEVKKSESSSESEAAAAESSDALAEFNPDSFDHLSDDEDLPPRKGLEMDGAMYHPIDSAAVPPGYASVPVRLVDDGYDRKVFDTSLTAGSVGMRYTASGDSNGDGLDSLQPISGWWMFVNREVDRDR